MLGIGKRRFLKLDLRLRRLGMTLMKQLVLARRMLVQVVSVALHLKIKHPTSQD
jgi:hypothetical protein